jgi:hypothetical protein
MDNQTLNSNGTVARRRGRPCAVERLRNEIMQQKLAHMITSNQVPSNEFAKLNILPIIVKRQRRVRANDRERNRMQSLNGALRVLRHHLPVELLMQESSLDLECNREPARRREPSEKKSKKSASSASSAASDSKVTKIDTLRMATRYIAMLSDMLRGDESSDAESSSNFTSTTTTATTGSIVHHHHHHHAKTNSSKSSVNSYESDSQQSPPIYSSASYFPTEARGLSCSSSADINANYYTTVNSNYSIKSELMEVTEEANHQHGYFSRNHAYYGNGGVFSSNHGCSYSAQPQPTHPTQPPPPLYNQYSSSSNAYPQFLRSNCIKYF